MRHVIFAGARIQYKTERKPQTLVRVVGAHHREMNRNLIERQRRLALRNLFSRLFSLIPPPPTRMSIPDMVEWVTGHINQFQLHVEELRQRRNQLEDEANRASISATTISPVINIIDSNSTSEVNLVTGSDMKLALSEVIIVVEEEGAEVISVSYKSARNMNVLSIHCQAASHSGNGVNSSRLLERLRTMIEE
ncbi:hypothetical protein PTKIN_Ptkin16aG0485700 [Pterospermum kingtungense]